MAVDIIGFINSVEPALSWDNAKKSVMLNDYVTYYNYKETIINQETGEEIPNPESKKNFANRMLQREITNKVKSVRKRAAEETVTYEELTFEIED